MPPVRTVKKNTVRKAGEKLKQPAALRADATEFQPGSSHHTVVKRETTESEAGLNAGLINESVPAPSEPAPKKRKLKPTTTGEKIADFPSTKDWEDAFHILVGTSTRKIKLGTGFVLKDDHIDDLIICRGPKICEKIWEFHFNFGDVDYNATNSARNLTDAAVCRLAQACPNLKDIALQDAANLTGESVKAFLTHCPKLTSLEITGGKSGNSAFSPDIFDAICETPAMVPNLRKLFITQSPARGSVNSMRELTKERPNLTIILVSQSEFKECGDWYLEENREYYAKGRKQNKEKFERDHRWTKARGGMKPGDAKQWYKSQMRAYRMGWW